MATAPAEDPIANLPRFDEHGLLPCIAQDFASGEVLMFAYMNEEALRLTRSTGELHLWSRSRGELWRKGQSSGNVMSVRSLRLDCDGDCLLALVEPAGPACHTGQRTCFFHDAEAEEDGSPRQAAEAEDDAGSPRQAVEAEDDAGSPRQTGDQGLQAARQPCEVLPALERTLLLRAKERPAGSYTVALLDDPRRIGEKVMEEAEEVARAARQESDRRVDEEAADVLYHLLVLMHSRGRRLADAARVLIGRASGQRG